MRARSGWCDQDGRIVLNDQHALDADQLALIPKPLHWATMDFA
jgi:hypothetical protein